MKVVNPVGGFFYMDDFLSRQLDKACKIVGEKDEDRVWLVDGRERAGKSVFAMQLAAKLDPNFDLSRVVYSSQAFKRAVLNARKGQAIIFDEAFKGLSSKGALSKINKLLTSLMMEMGQMNLFVFIVLPTFFELQRYVAVHRSQGLFHVYKKNGKRGFWKYYNQNQKLNLYMRSSYYRYEGKGLPVPYCRGRFFDQYVVDEVEYRRVKREALELVGEDVGSEEDVRLRERNICFKVMHDDLKVSYRQIQGLLLKHGLDLTYASISKAVKGLAD